MSGRMQRILVAVDLSSCSRAALQFACQIGRSLGATVEVLFVRPPSNDSSPDPVRAARTELHRFVHDVIGDEFPAPSERLEMGEPRARIVAIASEEKFDFIALGTHGRTGRARSLAGSVAESVVRTAPCPVMTVRER